MIGLYYFSTDFDLCQDYFQDLEFLDANPSSEEFEKSKIEFKNSLGKIYLKIQKFLSEEWKILSLFFIILYFILITPSQTAQASVKPVWR